MAPRQNFSTLDKSPIDSRGGGPCPAIHSIVYTTQLLPFYTFSKPFCLCRLRSSLARTSQGHSLRLQFFVALHYLREMEDEVRKWLSLERHSRVAKRKGIRQRLQPAEGTLAWVCPRAESSLRSEDFCSSRLATVKRQGSKADADGIVDLGRCS